MKRGVEIREHHAFETHLNLMSDFTGSRERISVIIISFGSHFNIVRDSIAKWFPSTRAKEKQELLLV
jgi:hypothetical protein